jgi:hypothetical protein
VIMKTVRSKFAEHKLKALKISDRLFRHSYRKIIPKISHACIAFCLLTLKKLTGSNIFFQLARFLEEIEYVGFCV